MNTTLKQLDRKFQDLCNFMNLLYIHICKPHGRLYLQIKLHCALQNKCFKLRSQLKNVCIFVVVLYDANANNVNAN